MYALTTNGCGNLAASITTEAVDGRTSEAKPTGSDFNGSIKPSRPMISYLYLSQGWAPGMKISQ